MEKFIYTGDEHAKDKLLSLGYELLKHDKENHLYVFLNNDSEKFSEIDVNLAWSDILTF